ncbi:hypothetical protein BJX68DRAFT_227334 [Aspergillus pseudodeflectus]|uniref:Uncharacterized protein n=1 Tax=Aspergillus pseudodeflectus TaxID=176178 RepID=A0ABR4L349_9EURO
MWYARKAQTLEFKLGLEASEAVLLFAYKTCPWRVSMVYGLYFRERYCNKNQDIQESVIRGDGQIC